MVETVLIMFSFYCPPSEDIEFEKGVHYLPRFSAVGIERLGLGSQERLGFEARRRAASAVDQALEILVWPDPGPVDEPKGPAGLR